jgi:hypothetical protein
MEFFDSFQVNRFPSRLPPASGLQHGMRRRFQQEQFLLARRIPAK